MIYVGIYMYMSVVGSSPTLGSSFFLSSAALTVKFGQLELGEGLVWNLRS